MGMAVPGWAQVVGPSACTPEAGDHRVTRWTSENKTDCTFPACVLQITGITHNSATISLDIAPNFTFGGQYSETSFPNDPKLVNVAVMGNDAKAGTRMWGKRIGEITSTILSGTLNVTDLEPNAHYVAVVYSPYLGYGNLNPFSMQCFRTARDPSNPYGGYRTGCFAHPTLDYAACVQARNTCNASPTTTWQNDRNRCIPSSN